MLLQMQKIKIKKKKTKEDVAKALWLPIVFNFYKICGILTNQVNIISENPKTPVSVN